MPTTEKIIDTTMLAYYDSEKKKVIAAKDELQALSDKVDEIISEGGEPNVIETVKVNGTALTPVNKAVDVEVPTKTSDLTNDGDGTSNFATEDYVDENGGKIDVIKVNGETQTITDKTVDIEMPVLSVTKRPESNNLLAIIQQKDEEYYQTTEVLHDENGNPIQVRIRLKTSNNDNVVAQMYLTTKTDELLANKANATDIPSAVSELTNDSGFQTSAEVGTAISTALANSGNAYQTASDVSSAISTAVSSVYKYKGSVASYSNLPASGNTTGDVYDVQDTGMNYAWNGTKWDELGSEVDLSNYWDKTTYTIATASDIDAILNA